MNIEETENGEKFWKEWDAFCGSLIEGIKRFDSRKTSQNFHTPALSPGAILIKRLTCTFGFPYFRQPMACQTIYLPKLLRI
jgi:hypothetical protein